MKILLQQGTWDLNFFLHMNFLEKTLLSFCSGNKTEKKSLNFASEFSKI